MMITLKENIKKNKKLIKEYWNKEIEFEIIILAFESFLTEIEKINCENCKHNKLESKCYTWDGIFFCSDFEEKE